MEFLASRGYAPEYGARPVKRALQREVQTLLAQVWHERAEAPRGWRHAAAAARVSARRPAC